MRFSVSVPVLSEQMKVTEPSVSTAGSLRMSAFWPTIFLAPSASDTDTTAGSASGIAATARLMAVSSISITGSPRSSPVTNRIAQMTSTAIARFLPKRARRFCSGVLPSSSARSSSAMRPSSVPMPVSTTTPRPRP